MISVLLWCLLAHTVTYPRRCNLRVKVGFCIECPSTSYCWHALTLLLGGFSYRNLLLVFPEGGVLVIQLFTKCCHRYLLLRRPMHLWDPSCICPGELVSARPRSLDRHLPTCSAVGVVTDVPLGQSYQRFPRPPPTTTQRCSGAQTRAWGAVWIRPPRLGW